MADIKDGSIILIGGFGQAGTPLNLVDALLSQGARELTVIANGIAQAAVLVENKRVRRLVASFPVWVARDRPNPLHEQLAAGEIELELVPQGTLAERVRAGGAGIPAFYVPAGIGTVVELGKEKAVLDGKEYLLERAIHADVALIKAFRGDRLGNLVYRMSARNFNPVMATAASLTVAEVEDIVDVGVLEPETVVTPGIFTDRVVRAPRRVTWRYEPSK